MLKPLRFVNNTVSLIGAAWGEGQLIPGVQDTPAKLRSAGLSNLIHKQLGYDLIDRGDITPENVKANPISWRAKHDSDRLRLLGALNHRLSDIVAEESRKKNLTLVLGGDNSLSSGSIHGQLKVHGDDLKVIWISAHADMNTFETSPSGNYHGMSLGHILGLMNSNEVAGFDWMHHKLKPENVVMIGIRALDIGEVEFIKNLGIRYYTPYKIDEMGGIVHTLNEIKSYLNLDGKPSPVHVSFDIDACDTSYVTAVGTPVDYGLYKREVSYLLKNLFRTGCLVNLDIAEINTELETLQRIKNHGDSPYIKTSYPTLFTSIELMADALGNASNI